VGYFDVIISKFNPNGTELVYSTYLGGDVGNDEGTGLIIDEKDDQISPSWL
jgi:hypothetical protein